MERAKQIAKAAWKLSGSLPYLRLVILAVILVLSVILFYSCGNAPSQNEKDLKQNTGEVVETKAETNVAVQEVKQAEAGVEVKNREVTAAKKAANKAVKAAEEKRNERQGDVTYEEANRARCTAFPQDSECRK